MVIKDIVATCTFSTLKKNMEQKLNTGFIMLKMEQICCINNKYFKSLKSQYVGHSVLSVRGVARGKYMWKQGRRSGRDRFVTQLCPAGGLGGRCNPPSGARQSPGSDSPWKQTHFWQQSIENWLKIRSLTSHVGKHESTISIIK